MRYPTIRGAMLLAAVALCALPQAANAAIDVTSDGAGGLRVASTADAAETVTIDRTAAGQLRIAEATSTTTSSDAACAVDVEQPTAVACTIASGATVTVLLGELADTLDAAAATGIALTVNGGGGADRFVVGVSGSTRITDSTGTDTIDMSRAEGAIRVRYRAAPIYRVVAACSGCGSSVRLPLRPGRVVLGSQADDVDLGTWRAIGRTTWTLGAGDDRFSGSPVRRSIVDAGEGNDVLISKAAADVLRGGPGIGRFADFGGAGDVLVGGPTYDFFASLDGKRDSISGAGQRDMCLSRTRFVTGCDGGPVRTVELSVYTPIVTTRTVLSGIGARP